MSEIELKFVTQQPALERFREQVLPTLEQRGAQCSQSRVLHLQNDYFDTPDQRFEANKMGLRVRTQDGEREQTIKTNGSVAGGLHQRAEYNVNIAQSEPDLTRFDGAIFPSDWDVQAISDQLTRQFSTHFKRTEFAINIEGSVVELVFDEGEVITDKAQQPLCEIELELKEGETQALFTLAHLLLKLGQLRLSDESKAAQGYKLLHGTPSQVKLLPRFLELDEDISTEDAFCHAAQCALAHWQYHEHAYLQGGSLKMLGEVCAGIRLLLQSVSLYLPVLQCPELLKLHKMLLDYAESWLWQDDLHSLRYLLSKKSVFAKRLSRHQALQSYLQGRKAGLLHAHDPVRMLHDAKASEIKLLIGQLLLQRPWRQRIKGFELPVMEHAKGWLSQGWQTVQQSMPSQRAMHAANYAAIEILLRQTLLNGFLLADLFATTRGEFRAPWLDILLGIDELKALLMLRHATMEAEVDEQEELLEWANSKIHNLLKVMERSRQVAMHADVYWE